MDGPVCEHAGEQSTSNAGALRRLDSNKEGVSRLVLSFSHLVPSCLRPACKIPHRLRREQCYDIPMNKCSAKALVLFTWSLWHLLFSIAFSCSTCPACTF